MVPGHSNDASPNSASGNIERSAAACGGAAAAGREASSSMRASVLSLSTPPYFARSDPSCAATSGAANVYPAAPYFLCELARGKPSRESALADVFGGCSAILRDAVRAFLDTFHGDGPDV